MMADLEDRPAVQKNHVEVGSRVADALVRQGDAAVEAENVEGAVETHGLLGLFVGEFLDPDHDRSQMSLQPTRDGVEGMPRQLLDIGERWRQMFRHGIKPSNMEGEMVERLV